MTKNLWLWVVLAFLILLGAWTALVIIAKRNQAERIELKSPTP